MQILHLDSGVFPPDLMNTILLLLPVKTLCGFKLVAKSWDAFISSPCFVHSHLRHPNRTQTLSIVSYNLRFPEQNIKILNLSEDCVEAAQEQIHTPHEILRVEASCNGLLCVIGTSAPKNSITLWNPATRKFRRLVVPYTATKYVHVGMCYIQETNNYKIVRIPNSDTGSARTVWVYSLNSDSWNSFNVHFEHHGALERWHPGVVNECIHWLTAKQEGNTKIAVWDANTEVLRYLDVPVIERSELLAMQLLNIEGSLSVVLEFLPNADQRQFILVVYEVWKMVQYGVDSSWSLIFSIGLPEIAIPVLSWQDRKLLFGYHKRDCWRFVSYDTSTAKIKNLNYPGDFYLAVAK